MKYLKIYKTLLKLNLMYLLEYRTNFLNSFISSVIWGSLSFVSILLLTAHTNSIYGWTRNELLLLTAVYNIITGMFHVIFSRSFEHFSRIIHFADLDSFLLKPIDPQFSMSFWYFNYTGFFRVIVGILVAVILLQGKIISSPFIIPLFIVFLILGVIILYSIWFLASTLIIKYTNLTNLVGLLYEMNGFARFPQDMYQGLGTFAFTFLLPLTIIITTPTRVLLERFTYTDFYITIGIAIFLFALCRISWVFALRFYTSASG